MAPASQLKGAFRRPLAREIGCCYLSLCLQLTSPFMRRICALSVSRSRNAAIKPSFPNTSVHLSNPRFRSACLTRSQERKTIYIKPEVFQNRARGLKRVMRIRKTIERLFAEAKTWHNMARACYRGRARVAIQVLFTFICLNVKTMAKG